MVEKRFKKLALGGTFDILHKGHKETLRNAFSLSEKVLIGLSTDTLVQNLHKKHKVNPYEERKKVLEEFLEKEGLKDRVEILPIHHRFGVAHEIQDLDAIMVSKETYPIALEINKIRKERGFKKLEVVILEKVKAEDGEPISSTKIREGKIDVEGRLLRKNPLKL